MQIREDLMKKQYDTFTKEHIDRILAEDRDADATGKLGQCSLERLLRESGALDDNGSKYGDLAQAAASYYVHQRMDDINERAYRMRKEKGHPGFYPGTAMGRLANEFANIDYDLSQRCERYTAVVDAGTEHLLASTGHLDHYEYDEKNKAVHFPADTRRLVDAGLGHQENTLQGIMQDVYRGGYTYEYYSHNQKLSMQDRFSELCVMPAEQGKSYKDRLFDEVYQSCNIAKTMDGFMMNDDNKVEHTFTDSVAMKHLFGNSAAAYLEKNGYFEYVAQREHVAKIHIPGNREIRNVPDFMKDGSECAVPGLTGMDF